MTHELTVKKLSHASWYGRCSCGEWTAYAKTPDRLRERALFHTQCVETDARFAREHEAANRARLSAGQKRSKP